MGQFLNAIPGKIPNFAGIKFTSTSLDEGVDALNANNKEYAVFLGADTVGFFPHPLVKNYYKHFLFILVAIRRTCTRF